MTLHTILIIILILVGIPASIYLLWFVHCALDRLCISHARRFSRLNGFDVRRVRCQPAFEQSGIKTESTLVQLDCFNQQNQRRLVLLLVWPFGVRKTLSDELYPDSYDIHWPQNNPSQPSL
jgi:hypothetical protein